MRVLLGSAVLLAAGAACAGGDAGGDAGDDVTAVPPPTRDGPMGPPSPDDRPPGTSPGTDAEQPADAPPSPDAFEPLPRPKATVPMSFTPPPIKPPSAPTDHPEAIAFTGTLIEAQPGCLLVEAANGRWELAGTMPEGFGVGDRVDVSGRPAPELEGACGAPVIRIQEVRAAP